MSHRVRPLPSHAAGLARREPVTLSWLFGLNNGTPASRATLVLAAGGLAALALPAPGWGHDPTAWVLRAAGFSLAVCSAGLRTSAREPVYLYDGPLIAGQWSVLPGEGIGPLRLGYQARRPAPVREPILKATRTINRGTSKEGARGGGKN